MKELIFKIILTERECEFESKNLKVQLIPLDIIRSSFKDGDTRLYKIKIDGNIYSTQSRVTNRDMLMSKGEVRNYYIEDLIHSVSDKIVEQITKTNE